MFMQLPYQAVHRCIGRHITQSIPLSQAQSLTIHQIASDAAESLRRGMAAASMWPLMEVCMPTGLPSPF